MFLMCLLAILGAGMSLKAQEVTITLNPGWNWISYPNAMAMDVSEAFGGFVPMAGDIVKSRLGSSTYINGQWRGGVTQFTPGLGYMYYSSRIETISFVFAQSTSSFVVTDIPTNITATSAVVGGIVTLAEGNHIFARGVCWGTEPNPNIDGNHLAGDNVAGSQSFTLDGLNIGTIYYVRAYAATDNGLAYGEELSFTTEDGSGDHAYVDLGLPSGTLWAICNVGADTPEDYGDYFAWGETQPKDYYEWNNYQYCNGNETTLTKYSIEFFDWDCECYTNNGYNGFTDNLTTLLPEDDAATANWGYGWRMPTQTEWQELLDNTTSTLTTQNGVYGRLFTASNGNSIFLPAAGSCYDSSPSGTAGYGEYWSSSLVTDYPSKAWILYFGNTDCFLYGGDRNFGQSVRPVRSSGQNNAPTGAINGLFSVSTSQQVYFSQGNLQYQASTDTWKFAENQWDYVGSQNPVVGNPGGTVTGSDNSNISSSYSGWIDLFGWGTSGYNHGANCYQPWSTSQSNSDYYAYGSYTYNLYDQTGKADWGYNPISNGGNVANLWRTLTQSEWNYVIYTRTTTSGIRYAKANVNNVNGVILLPDDWSSSTYSLSNTNTYSASFSSNTLTASQWSALEQAGAVFLPAAGYQNGTSVGNVGSYGGYWSASYRDSNYVYYVYFHDSSLHTDNYYRYLGRSVRLVRVAE